MDKTKIEWCDSTWNPVTGCLHGCEYCYARRIAERFGGCTRFSTSEAYRRATQECNSLFEVDETCQPVRLRFNKETEKLKKYVAPYPYGFQPTLRRDRLNQYEKKEGRTIFVCSMADLFGKWVPDSWIEEVFAACRRAPQHRYLFLTKNPKRYIELDENDKLPTDDNMWYGSTATDDDMPWFYSEKHNTFVSVEPIQKAIHPENTYTDWIIVGAETGNRKGKVVPPKEWIDAFVSLKIPVLMKDSLIPIVGEENMIREFPWEVK